MNKMNNKFLPFISHKLLTPATIIKWNSELLKKEVENGNYDKVLERINDIIENNNKQIDFVNKYLDRIKTSDNLDSLESSIMDDFVK